MDVYDDVSRALPHLWRLGLAVQSRVRDEDSRSRWSERVLRWLAGQVTEEGRIIPGSGRALVPLPFDLTEDELCAVLAAAHDFCVASGRGKPLIDRKSLPSMQQAVWYATLGRKVAELRKGEAERLTAMLDCIDEEASGVGTRSSRQPAARAKDGRTPDGRCVPHVVEAACQENPPKTPNLSGVSLRSIAIHIRKDDPEGQNKLVKKWQNRKGNSTDPLPDPIGTESGEFAHRQRRLYEPSAVLAFLKKVEGERVVADFDLNRVIYATLREAAPILAAR